MSKKTIVISGINLYEGGPLTVYYNCLDSVVSKKLYEQYDVIAFVHKKELFRKYGEQINLIELPKSRNSYLFRLYYEYIYFNKFSKNKDIYVWLSLHDITPRVKAEKQYTYCHNPMPFYKTKFSMIVKKPVEYLFAKWYKYLYMINIGSNEAVIVQQNWIRKEFKKMFKKIKNIIVARPIENIENYCKSRDEDKKKNCTFVYAAFPRSFKNMEVICEACSILNNRNLEVMLTVDGTENKYSANLVKKYGHLKNIEWLGIQSREKVFELYQDSDCMIFPSLLETWGLPISEYKVTQKPLLVADMPYAHETVGTYDKISFFDPYNPKELAELMSKVVDDTIVWNSVIEEKVEMPYVQNWDDLLDAIVRKEEK